jgi:hypothetical protein
MSVSMTKSMSSWVKRQGILTISLLISGCAVGPDFSRPAAPETSRLTRDPIVTTTSSAGPTGEAQTLERGTALQADWW